jgi:hypothetical protein
MESCALCLDTVFSQRVPPVPSSQLNPLQTHSDTADLRLKSAAVHHRVVKNLKAGKNLAFPKAKKDA